MCFRNLSYAVILLILMAAVTFGGGAKQPYTANPWTDPGGPDAYGYTWLSSDDPGGPAVEWIDITATGTPITGLGDDNYVGPYSVGFDFDYYWYAVDQVYVGSNGYIKFPPGTNIASPFPGSIPLSAAPNDFIAMFLSDLIFAGSAEAYYWSNNVDQFVVSFLNMPAWSPAGPTGSRDFQVVFDGTTGDIHLNYGHHEGTVYNNDILIGIENCNGLVGLEHSHDTYIPHDNYSVFYYYPDTTTYEAHDLALSAAMNENSQGIFIEQGQSYSPVAWVKNVGNQVESGATVTCRIFDPSSSVIYNESFTMGTINPGDEVMISFSPSVTINAIGCHTMNVNVNLPGDMNPANNDKMGELQGITLPGEFLWDDGSSEYSWSWSGGTGGIGQRFEPPDYPVIITMVKYYIVTVSSNPTFIAKIYDDDGFNGLPGTILFDDIVTCTAGGNHWYTIDTNISINSGAFYVSWEMTGENSTTIGNDQAEPFSRNAMEYTGVWSVFRDAEVKDPMIRAMITMGAPPDVQVDLTPLNPPIIIPANGGSFGFLIEVSNSGTSPATLDVWTTATLPNGHVYGPIIGPVNLTMAAGFSIERERNQVVPAGAPTGAYTYDAYVGLYPGTVWGEDHFGFEKSAAGDGGFLVHGWANWGESFDDFINEASALSPEEFALHAAYPNPFNPSATIAYELKEAANVRLVVYDISGRIVATLVDGWVSGGAHQAVFTADNLSSGIYFCHLTAGNFSDTKKMVLMK